MKMFICTSVCLLLEYMSEDSDLSIFFTTSILFLDNFCWYASFLTPFCV